MSARQPFIPQQPAVASGDSSSDSLKADTSVSSDGESLRTSSSATSMSLHSSHPDDIPLLGGINKPLNLANLGKKQKPSIEEHPPHKPIARRSFEDDANRPFSPSFKAYKPLANQRGMKAAPSSPFFPSTASFQSMSAFRTPRVPSPTKRHSAASIDSLNINNAHTTTGRDDLEHVDDINHYEDTSHDGPLRLARSGTRDLEDQTDQANENRSRNGLSGGTEGFSYDGTASAFEDRYTRMPARRVQKRVERAENDVEPAYAAPKRYKLDDDQELQSNFAGRRESVAPYQSSPQRSPSPAASHAGSVYAPRGERAPAPAADVPKEHALLQLFGQETDMFINAHLDAYEDAKKKWANCSIDEWKAGADELTGKFGKLLDFVKDHMSTKLALYASLNTTLSSHRQVLAEREKTLEDVRDNLIRNGGNVCGIGKGLGGLGGGKPAKDSDDDDGGAD